MEIQIVQEQPLHHEAVFELNTAAFERDTEAKLVNALRKGTAFIPELSLLAFYGEKPVGYILFTRIFIEDEQGNRHESLALAPMAVMPGYQKLGVGGKLVHAGLEKAREMGFNSVIVLGHAEYYPRFGFAPADNWDVYTYYEVPPEYFMALELRKGGLQGVSGMVEYAPEFAAEL